MKNLFITNRDIKIGHISNTINIRFRLKKRIFLTLKENMPNKILYSNL